MRWVGKIRLKLSFWLTSQFLKREITRPPKKRLKVDCSNSDEVTIIIIIISIALIIVIMINHNWNVPIELNWCIKDVFVEVKSLKRKNYYKNELLSLECEWASCADVFEKVHLTKDTILEIIKTRCRNCEETIKKLWKNKEMVMKLWKIMNVQEDWKVLRKANQDLRVKLGNLWEIS